MTSKKGLKLHSIIEKLSEQCVRVSPTHDDSFAEEDEEIVMVTMEAPVQRRTSRNAKTKRQKQRAKSKKSKTTAKKVDKEKKRTENPEKRENFQPVDEDLCIDVNAMMRIVPQMQDIDTANVHLAHYSWPLKKDTCRICFQQLKSRDDLLGHIRESHPDAFKKLPANVEDDVTVGRSVEENEEEEEEVEEEVEEIVEEEEEEVEESDDDSHGAVDPDFNVDADIVSDVSDVSDGSSDEMVLPKMNTKRRSARIRAKNRSESEQKESEDKSISNEPEEVLSPVYQVESDIHIDVEKIINTSPKLQDIDLPKTKEFACELCEEKFYFQLELERHIEERHSESVDNSKSQDKTTCEHCGKEFLSRMGLFLHIRKLVRKIEQGERSLEERRKKREEERTCRECGKMFKNLGSLKKHFLTHSDSRPFKCELCDRTFKDKNYIYRHMKIHSGIKSYECKLCKKLFAHSGSLRTHNMLHTGERPFKCQFCNTGFISRFDLKVHENKHTGNMPYKCPHCPKGFPKSNNLKMHLISHSTDKPFPCEVCGKAFKRRDHLRYHLVIHSDDKPYKCETCNRTFNQHICLRKHLPCRELEKLKKRANKPKENSPKKQKTALRSPKNKQVTDAINKTSSTTTVAGDPDMEQDINMSDRTGVEDGAISDQQVTDSAAGKNQQTHEETETSQMKEDQSKNTDEVLSSHIVGSISSAQKQNYEAESHVSDAVDPVLINTRQVIDSEMALHVASLMGRGASSTAVPHCAMDKIDFTHEYRNPRHETSSSSIRTLGQPPRLIEACHYTSTVHHPFVPFNCTTHAAHGMEYEGGGLELETLPSDSNHGNMLSNRSFAQETSSELSSALLAAMDPDNLSAMVENNSAYFPLRHS